MEKHVKWKIQIFHDMGLWRVEKWITFFYVIGDGIFNDLMRFFLSNILICKIFLLCDSDKVTNNVGRRNWKVYVLWSKKCEIILLIEFSFKFFFLFSDNIEFNLYLRLKGKFLSGSVPTVEEPENDHFIYTLNLLNIFCNFSVIFLSSWHL